MVPFCAARTADAGIGAYTGHQRTQNVYCIVDGSQHRISPCASQRLIRGNAHLNHEDEKFSYLIIRRGPRPTKPEPPRPPRPTLPSKEELTAAAFHWPRLVRQPLRRTGHVILDMCSPSGNVLREGML